MRSDYGFGGFFELRTPQDLLGKLRRDYQRVLSNPLSTDAAFDFFLTANHVVDWVWPSDRDAQRRCRDSESIPRICAHLADGAKHFLLSSPHRGVSQIRHADAAFSRSAFSGAFQIGGLYVTLDSEEAASVGAETVTVPALAKLVLNYWEQRFGWTLTD